MWNDNQLAAVCEASIVDKVTNMKEKPTEVWSKLLIRAPGFNGESSARRTEGQVEPRPTE